jgi:hypothetical protein
VKVASNGDVDVDVDGREINVAMVKGRFYNSIIIV